MPPRRLLYIRLFLGSLLVGLLSLPACRFPGSASSSSSKGQGQAQAENPPQVTFQPSGGGEKVQVRVEIARTEAEVQRGLMFRRSLEADTGMLFLFDRPEIRRFWMRNCYIPLDMIFLDENKNVVGIEENTIPGDETGRGPDRPAQYVVEVAGGYARRHGIGPGAHVEFRNVD